MEDDVRVEMLLRRESGVAELADEGAWLGVGQHMLLPIPQKSINQLIFHFLSIRMDNGMDIGMEMDIGMDIGMDMGMDMGMELPDAKCLWR